MDIKHKVGARIDQLRKKAKLSKTCLGWDSDLDPSYVMEVIKGERNISLMALQKICVTFKISIYDFFNDEQFN